MQVNTQEMKRKMAEAKITQEKLAKETGMDNSTFIRKMHAQGLSFTVGQMHRIVEVLNLTKEEAVNIFLN